jgi:hypothetical protein
MLIEKAAEQWKTETATLVAADETISDPKAKRYLRYGEITHGENLVRIVSTDDPFTPESAWKTAGKPIPGAQGRAFVTGKHVYPSDVERPGMLFGAVLRPDGSKAVDRYERSGESAGRESDARRRFCGR